MAMLKRDPETGRIISYTPISDKKNEGSLDIALLDGRYIRSDFVNFVNVKFSSLPDAINAEIVVSQKISTIKDQSLIPGEFERITGQPPPQNLLPEQIQALAAKEYLKSIGNLIDTDSDSTFALQSKIDELQAQLEQKDSIISDQLQSINNFDDVLASIAYERNVAINRNDRLREANISLQQQADEILFRTELEVAKQREQSIQSAQDLKNSLLNVSDKTAEITNLQSQFNDVSQNLSGVQNYIGGIQSDIVRQESLLQDVDTKSSDAANQATDANNKADASLFRMEEANDKINDISEDDNAKVAFDKVFPI
jgi:hypothetical protein